MTSESVKLREWGSNMRAYLVPQQWEYAFDIVEQVNCSERGEQGWGLAAVDKGVYVFKRPVPKEPESEGK